MIELRKCINLLSTCAYKLYTQTKHMTPIQVSLYKSFTKYRAEPKISNK